jgi:hypothetical protein
VRIARALPRLRRPMVWLLVAGRERRVEELLLRPSNREIHATVADLTALHGGCHRLEKASASIRPERRAGADDGIELGVGERNRRRHG